MKPEASSLIVPHLLLAFSRAPYVNVCHTKSVKIIPLLKLAKQNNAVEFFYE